MYKLSYFIGASEIESFYFPSYALCRWKEKQLKGAGSHISGHFTIVRQ